jgi:hypothetical protein
MLRSLPAQTLAEVLVAPLRDKQNLLEGSLKASGST